MRSRFGIFAILFISLFSGSPANSAATAPTTPRSFNIFVSTKYSPTTPVPLIIALHGFNQSGAKFEKYLNLTPVAQADDIIYVHPDGTADTHGVKFWNGTPECCDFQSPKVDDDAYIMSIIDSVSAQYAIDPNRIYIIGHSNGGFMANRLACDHADRIAAIVNMAGGSFTTASACKPAAPISVLEIWGTSDETFKGNHILGKPIPGAAKTFNTWALINKCSKDSQVVPQKLDLDKQIPGTETSMTQYLDCPSGTAIDFWKIDGARHVPVLSNYFAPDIVDWLLAHPKVIPSITNQGS